MDKNGTLYSFNIENSKTLNWKSNLSYNKKIGNMSLSHHEEHVFFIVDNTLHAIDAKTGEIEWKKELRAPVRGEAVVINNKLAVLTIDNYLYVIDIKDGSSVWTYQNGISEIRGLYSVSPAIFDDKIIAPFANGELIAFNEDGKKLWSQKLSTNLLDTQLTDITTTPKVHDGILIATNNSHIYGIDVKSGNILWSQQLQVRSMSNIGSLGQYNGAIFVLDKNNEATVLDIHNGKMVWFIMPINTLLATTIYADMLWMMTDKDSIIVFQELDGIPKRIKIPANVFHTPVFTRDKIYVTTEKNGVYSLENRFVIYD